MKLFLKTVLFFIIACSTFLALLWVGSLYVENGNLRAEKEEMWQWVVKTNKTVKSIICKPDLHIDYM